MRNLLIPLTLLLFAAPTAGCEQSKSPAQTNEANKNKTVAPANPSQPSKTNAATKTAARAQQPNANKEAVSCAGKGKECAGGCNQWNQAANDVLKREVPNNVKWTTLSVEGMTCGGCERRIIANVGSVEGVLKVEADAELGQVRVATPPDNHEVLTKATARISSLGYQITK